MNKLFLFAILGLCFLSACTTAPQIPVCNSPYIFVGNSCCLDQNNNKVCDSDEKIEFSSNNINIQAGWDVEHQGLISYDTECKELIKNQNFPYTTQPRITLTCNVPEKTYIGCEFVLDNNTRYGEELSSNVISLKTGEKFMNCIEGDNLVYLPASNPLKTHSIEISCSLINPQTYDEGKIIKTIKFKRIIESYCK